MFYKKDIKELIKNHLDKYNKIELMYPNRYKEIHKSPCKNCPSIFNKENKIIDLENEEVKNYPREEQIKSVFPCGWRGSKLCKGYCDEFNIKEKDLI
jgi:hypothetical protein